MHRLLIAATLVASLGGCTQLQFGDGYNAKAASFYDPQPVAIMTRDKDCKVTVEVKTVQGKARWVRPTAGLTGGKLSATFEDGMLKTFGQDVEGGATALKTLTGALKEAGVLAMDDTRDPTGAPATSCTPEIAIQPINWNGTERIVLTPPGG